jgi:hypothetical protein
MQMTSPGHSSPCSGRGLGQRKGADWCQRAEPAERIHHDLVAVVLIRRQLRGRRIVHRPGDVRQRASVRRAGVSGPPAPRAGSAGIGALSSAKLGRISTVACWPTGRCEAAGEYETALDGGEIAFTVTASHGDWGAAQQLRGFAALNAGPGATGTGISSLACPSAGNCSAVGSYQDAGGHLQVFVDSEQHGGWASATEIRGSAALNTGGTAYVNQVSCGSAGNCSAGGLYSAPTASDSRAFVVTEHRGIWGKAEEVPGTAMLNTGNSAAVVVVSCGSAGNCSAGGSYTRHAAFNPPDEVFVVTERNGVWGKAEEVPGTATLNSGGDAGVFAMFCNRGGQCAAGGQYEAGQQRFQAFLVSRG